MPEILEVEAYRRQAEAAVGRTVAEVHAPDEWYVKGSRAADVIDAVTGRTIVEARRRGKLLVLDLCDGPRLGLRFGMTGRLILDGEAAIDRLEYTTGRDDPRWDRFALVFTDRQDLRLRDPRRLGGIELDPREDHLGVDGFDLAADDLAMALDGSSAPLKARLLDQSRVAGIGNLLADEILWRAGLDPTRAAGSLDDGELGLLHATIASTLRDLMERGGSHTGDLRAGILLDGRCPLDGELLQRGRVGGRTTHTCPAHQT